MTYSLALAELMARVDTASKHVRASPQAIFDAFATPGAMEQWLPPGGMRGEMLHFDWREGGRYRMRLTYEDPRGARGKTSDASDEVEVRLVRLEPGRRIVQEGQFDSPDPAFAGTMRMTWDFESEGDGTLVTVRAEDVPAGISHADHQAGLDASLGNLARFVETRERRDR